MSTQQQELFSKLTLDAEVTATFDQDMGDKYEVTLLLADGMNVNKEIIQSGQSQSYKATKCIHYYYQGYFIWYESQSQNSENFTACV